MDNVTDSDTRPRWGQGPTLLRSGIARRGTRVRLEKSKVKTSSAARHTGLFLPIFGVQGETGAGRRPEVRAAWGPADEDGRGTRAKCHLCCGSANGPGCVLVHVGERGAVGVVSTRYRGKLIGYGALADTSGATKICACLPIRPLKDPKRLQLPYQNTSARP